MKKFIYIILISVVFISCNNSLYVKEMAAPEMKEKAVSYYLPEKSLDINVSIRKYHFIPGPYANYAKTFLSLENIEKQEEHYWDVDSIAIEENILPDTENKFYMFSDKTMPEIHFTASGILKSVNTKPDDEINFKKNRFYQPEKQKDKSEINYSNLQINRSKYEVLDTTYRTVTTDSVVKRIPVYRTKERVKTLKHKAKDAAEFIIRIRKSRFSLEAALEDQQLSGVDVEVMINKLEKLEQSYLELFTGTTEVKKVEYTYTVKPESLHQEQNYIVAYFDKITAEQIEKKAGASKLTLNIKPLISTWGDNDKSSDKKWKIIARKPMPVKYEILLNNKKLYSSYDLCPQMGWLNKIPYKKKDKKAIIRLDPETGALISTE